MEGITGIVDHRQQCWPDGAYFAQGTRFATNDLNALVEGALDGGAEEIVVWLGHCAYPGGIDAERLHPGCKVIFGANDGGPVGLDGSFDGMMLLGLHAMAGTANAVLAHSFMPHIREVWLNGLLIGEIGMLSVTAGSMNVPVAFISGDRAAVEEARRLVPDAVGVAVKEGFGGVMGLATAPTLALAPADTSRLIREGARQAVQKCKEMKPFSLEPPYEMKVVYTEDKYAASMAGKAGVTHTAPCVIEMRRDRLDDLVF